MQTPSEMPGARGSSDIGISSGNDVPVSNKSRALIQGIHETEEQVQATFLSLPSVSDDGLDRLGIDRRIANRAGGLAWANITTAGRGFDFDPSGIPSIIQGVWRGLAPSIESGVEHPILADLIAWRPAEPGRWWHRWDCDTPALGDEYVEDAHAVGPLFCHLTPLDWLRSGCRGTVLLHFAEHFALEFGRAAA